MAALALVTMGAFVKEVRPGEGSSGLSNDRISVGNFWVSVLIKKSVFLLELNFAGTSVRPSLKISCGGASFFFF